MAPTTPPETGASTKVPREADIRVEMWRDVEISMVDESMKSLGDVEAEDGW